MKENNNTTHIESLRGIAALMVVLFHFVTFTDGNKFLFESQLVRKISEFGAQGVEMFYIISGFVMMVALKRSNYNINKYLIYLSKRCIRILPTYWITILLICTVSFCLHTFLWGIPYDWNARNIITNATFTADFFQRDWINPIFITLKIEFQFYILIGLVYPFWNKNFFIKLIFILVSLGLTYLSSDYNNVLKYLPYFLIGMTTQELYVNKNSKFIFLLILPITFVLIFNKLDDLFIVVLTTLLISYPFSYSKIITKMGEISYSLYLTHGISGGWTIYFLYTYFGNKMNIIFLLTAIIISVLFAFVVHQLIEKPTLILSQKIKYSTSLKLNLLQFITKNK
jgi:exopolysaccharide production protein ExoZ